MNLIRELDKIAVDMSIKKNPLNFIIFQELYLNYNNDYEPIYLGGYQEIFNKTSLYDFFEGELSYHDILKAHDLSKFELRDQKRMLPLIKERLEEVKQLDSPAYNQEKLIILKSIVKSSNQYISLPYLGKSLHKNELLTTLLAITEWNYDFVSVGGWGLNYVAITFVKSIFTDIVDLEVYLPYVEMKNLIEQLPDYQNSGSLKSVLEYTKKYNDEAEKMLKRIDNDLKER